MVPTNQAMLCLFLLSLTGTTNLRVIACKASFLALWGPYGLGGYSGGLCSPQADRALI